MFHSMRRKRQLLSPKDCAAVLERGTSGVLSLQGDEPYPYAVPLSYIYHDNKLYFHCAKSGHKLEAIATNPRGCFCVIDQDQVVPAEYTTYYRSVVVFGTLRVLEDEGEKQAAIDALAVKYAPTDAPEHRETYIHREWDRFCMLEMTVDHLSGKQAIELVQG